MRVVRKSVFETNSSSTHSICISKSDMINLPKVVHFGFGEYGWEDNTVYNTADYLHTAIYETEQLEYIDVIKEILDRNNVLYTFDTNIGDGYIGHGGGLREFVQDVCGNENRLLRYLFGDSVIYTGNDNSNDEEDDCYCADREFIDGAVYNDRIPNPKHDEEKYEYYFKSN